MAAARVRILDAGRRVCGMVLVFAAVTKACGPCTLLASLPIVVPMTPALAASGVVLLVFLEASVGGVIALHRQVGRAEMVAIGMLGLSCVYLAVAGLVRGPVHRCGCFGGVLDLGWPLAAARNSLMVAILGWSWYRTRRRLEGR